MILVSKFHNRTVTVFEVFFQHSYNTKIKPFTDEVQTTVFKGPVRTAL